jgi:hypothetical protein
VPDPVWSTSLVQVGSDRSALVTVAAVGRFWLPDGNRVVYERALMAEDYELETILLGTVAGLLLHQRSLLLLHTSCVLLYGRAMAISGPSAMGKSALAAVLVKRGALLISDDLCVLHNGPQGFRVTTGANRLRLWPNVLDRLEIAPELCFPVRRNHPKRSVAMPTTETCLWPLSLLIRLSSNQAATPSLDKHPGLHALFPPNGLIFLREVAARMGNRENEFNGIMEIANNLPQWLLIRTRLMDQFEACADLIVEAAREFQ